ncbi:hypothetical protein PACTADRAFT_76070 [Pachysolen tannophilus NRRL Y-2460]|uniref:Major facilitator superfamily (MFS) profile domain-containing protein n=1 Tax=Pachysolen tannophilus NRRL Y-2460 TaxID=669874 RepID=A0A1E4TV54_PACTA|nr:hypothetical protein PACTADRAFT_76070 [Pachysolen tannophilus NRRL Y-2460]
MSEFQYNGVDEKLANVNVGQKEDSEAVLAQVISSIRSHTDHAEYDMKNDVDEAMYLALKSKGVTLDEITDKKLLRKIDFHILPLCCILYSIQYMDKTTTSYASIMGITEDLDMVGNMYSWTGTAFYFGYLIFVFQASYLLQKFPLSKATAIFIFLWGAILCLNAACTTYKSFVTLRVLLGMFESSITPSMMILTSQWYKKEEQFLRTAIWFSFNGLGTIMGSGIAYGLAIHADSYSVTAWKLLFIITGVMSIFVSILWIFIIPDSPSNAWFLNEEEKLMIVERIRENKQGFGNKHFKKYQFIEAISSPLTYLYAFYSFCTDVPNGGLGSFGSILLTDDFGFTTKKALIMSMPGGAVEVVGCIAIAFFMQKKLKIHRMLLATINTALVLIYSCMLAFASHSKKTRLAGYYLFSTAPIGMICALSCFSSNTAGHTKKIIVNAIFLVGYCVGNIVGPQTFKSSEAPHYQGAKIAIVICYCFAVALMAGAYIVCSLENKKRDKLQAENPDIGISHIQNSEFADLTDKENVNFRYEL